MIKVLLDVARRKNAAVAFKIYMSAASGIMSLSIRNEESLKKSNLH